MESNDLERLAQIGLVMEGVGINTVELAEKLKAHVAGCPGGQKCIEALNKQQNAPNPVDYIFGR